MHERVRDLLQSSRVLVFVSPSATVRETSQVMDRHNVGSVLIIDSKDDLVGIFTERDLVKRVVAAGLDPDETRISDVMTREVSVVAARTPADDVFKLMNEKKCRHVPVTDGNRILGVVSLRDLLRRDREFKEMEISEMRRYFHDRRDVD